MPSVADDIYLQQLVLIETHVFSIFENFQNSDALA